MLNNFPKFSTEFHKEEIPNRNVLISTDSKICFFLMNYWLTYEHTNPVRWLRALISVKSVVTWHINHALNVCWQHQDMWQMKFLHRKKHCIKLPWIDNWLVTNFELVTLVNRKCCWRLVVCLIYHHHHHHHHHHHQLNVHFLPRLIKGMDGSFPTALGRQSDL